MRCCNARDCVLLYVRDCAQLHEGDCAFECTALSQPYVHAHIPYENRRQLCRAHLSHAHVNELKTKGKQSQLSYANKQHD